MDEAWERAVEAALAEKTTPSSELRSLNLDGAVTSLHGCLPPAMLLERFPGLEHLSIANVGAPSLEKFPRLRNLQRLILSDNRIAGGLENLVEAGLQSLRDLDLSNNRIQYIEDLAPLAKLHLVSLDLYECPVTRISDYRSKVFSMIRTLKYLDKLDNHGNERPETDDDEDDEEEEEDYEDDEEDPGSGEVDGEDRAGKLASGGAVAAYGDEGIVDVDEYEGSDADEEEMRIDERVTANGSARRSSVHIYNGYRLAAAGTAYVEGDEEDVEDEDEDESVDDLGEEIDEEGEDDDDDDVIEVHDVLGSDEEEDGVDDVDDENDLDGEEDDEGDEDEEDDGDDDEVRVEDADEDEMGVEDKEEDAELGNSGRLASTEGEIDGHEHGEEDENGEVGEEENGDRGEEDEQAEGNDRDSLEDDGEGEDEDELAGEYLVQPIVLPNGSSRQSSHFNITNEEDEVNQEENNQNAPLQHASPSSDTHKRRRDEEGDLDDETYMEHSKQPKCH